MPADLPYMNTSGNIGAILDRMVSAGTPPKFTHEFLRSLGFTSSNDRGITKILKQLGFLDDSGVPTERYHQYRHPDRSGQILAEGLRAGWKDIFLVDTKAYEKGPGQLAGTFSSVTGKGEAVAQKMASTFKALADKADFSTMPLEPTPPVPPSDSMSGQQEPKTVSLAEEDERAKNVGVALHQDIHIHLPATTDVAVYTAIFRALRNELVD